MTFLNMEQQAGVYRRHLLTALEMEDTEYQHTPLGVSHQHTLRTTSSHHHRMAPVLTAQAVCTAARTRRQIRIRLHTLIRIQLPTQIPTRCHPFCVRQYVQ